MHRQLKTSSNNKTLQLVWLEVNLEKNTKANLACNELICNNNQDIT